MIIKWHLSIGTGEGIEDTFEMNDNATDKQIEEAVEEYALCCVDWYWEK